MSLPDHPEWNQYLETCEKKNRKKKKEDQSPPSLRGFIRWRVCNEVNTNIAKQKEKQETMVVTR